MAKEAGFIPRHNNPNEWWMMTGDILRFAELVAAQEREACAALIEPMGDYCGGHGEPRAPSARELAATIRAKEQTP
jgi:hypothetical protein